MISVSLHIALFISLGILYSASTVQLFERYALPSGKEQVEFTVDVTTLLDMLRIFIASDVGGLHMQYPGEHQELLLKSVIHQDHGQEDQHLLPTVFSKIETLAFADSANLSEYLQEPCSTIFSNRGSIFKDSVDGVHVAGNTVLIEMKDHPPQLTLSSVTPDIEVYVDVPIQSLTGFTCTSPVIHHAYDTKYVVRAFSVSPNRKVDAGYDSEHHCGISIDPQGLIKVVHMWKSVRGNVTTTPDTQEQGGDSQSMVVTQFLILPKADEGGSEHHQHHHDDGVSSRANN